MMSSHKQTIDQMESCSTQTLINAVNLSERMPTNEQLNQRLTNFNQPFKTETNSGEVGLNSTIESKVQSTNKDGLSVLCNHCSCQRQDVSSAVEAVNKVSVEGDTPCSTCMPLSSLATQLGSQNSTMTSSVKDTPNSSISKHLDTKTTVLDTDRVLNVSIQKSDLQVLSEDSKTVSSCVSSNPLPNLTQAVVEHSPTDRSLTIQPVGTPIEYTLSDSKDVLCDNKFNEDPAPKNEGSGLVQTVINEGDVEMEPKASGRMEDSKRRRRKRNRNNTDAQVESMDHSGLEQETKRSKIPYKDGAMLCLTLSSDIVERGRPEAVARELARCLHESKHILIGEVVRVLGVETTLDLFQKASDIQESGGQLTVDGDKKKAPGGVFLSLVKQMATPEEKEGIFRKDKQITEQKKKMEKRRKWMERERREKALMEKKAEWELRVFQTQLGYRGPSASVTEWNCSLSQLRQKDTNIHKRLGKRSTEVDSTKRLGKKYNDVCKAGGTEAMDIETNVKSNGLSRHSCKVLDQERKAAEEFEEMKECQLDFGFDLD